MKYYFFNETKKKDDSTVMLCQIILARSDVKKSEQGQASPYLRFFTEEFD